MRIAIVDGPIDVSSLLAELSHDSTGATVLFLGTVRNTHEGRTVTGMEYSAYRGMAEREMANIARAAVAKFETPHIIVEHRIGALAVGDASVAIAVAHAHRAAAYDASRFVIEQIKQRVPIWKLEHYTDGTREWVRGTAAANPTLDEEVNG